jgi:5-deoxy-glucuronate isomerase
MLKKLNNLSIGYTPCTQENGAFAFTKMDTGIYVLELSQTVTFSDDTKETAILLLTGDIELQTTKTYSAQRDTLFKERPYCLHVSRGVTVTVTAQKKSELLIMKTTNDAVFPEVFYTPEQIKDRFLGVETWEGTARRLIRDIFNYDNAPYSNLVLGEIINLPGKWSSYTPHWHRQPEVYYYKFDRAQGFGACFIGDEVFTVNDNSFAAIPGGLCHPQVAAPGYAMYYTWIIRHLENDPWQERIVAPEHDWLNAENPQILKL